MRAWILDDITTYRANHWGLLVFRSGRNGPRWINDGIQQLWAERDDKSARN